MSEKKLSPLKKVRTFNTSNLEQLKNKLSMDKAFSDSILRKSDEYIRPPRKYN